MQMKRILVLGMFVVLCLGLATSASAQILTNGDFEAGSAGWTEWSSPGGWTTGVFGHDYASGLTIWNPAPYPYNGLATHGQGVGTNNVHGGLYQVVDVIPGVTYSLSGMWSGGIGGLNAQNNTIVGWFEVTVYDGAVTPTEIDAAPGINDTVIAKREWSSSFAGETYNFPWEAFSGTFVPQGSQVTVALKTGKVGDWDAIAAYHDDMVIQGITDLPTMGEWGMIIFSVLAGISSIFYLRRMAAKA